MDAITAEVIGPSGPVHMNLDLKSNGGHGTFRTEEMGMHEVLVKNEGETIRGAPHFLRSMPMSKKDYDGEIFRLFSLNAIEHLSDEDKPKCDLLSLLNIAAIRHFYRTLTGQLPKVLNYVQSVHLMSKVHL